MAETTKKVLNARLLTRIDTLDAWNKSTAIIKKGEICLATIDANTDTGLTESVVMLKVGTDEEKTFTELPWSFYARSSDVVSCCKSEDDLTDFISDIIANAGLVENTEFLRLVDIVDGLYSKDEVNGMLSWGSF